MIDRQAGNTPPPHPNNYQPDSRNSHSLKRTSRVEFRKNLQLQWAVRQQQIKERHVEVEQYEEDWQHQFLNKLAREMIQEENQQLMYAKNIQQNSKVCTRQAKSRQMERISSKHKKKQFQKYKAYAVKMKIPSLKELGQIKLKQEKRITIANEKKIQNNHQHRPKPQQIHPRVQQLIKSINSGDHMIQSHIESINNSIFRRAANKEKKPNIRKKSIKHSEKKKDSEDLNRQNNECMKRSQSPRTMKKLKMSLEECSNSINNGRNNVHSEQKQRQLCNKSEVSNKQTGDVKISEITNAKERQSKSPPRRTYLKISPMKEQTSIAMQYLQKGINFKPRSKIIQQNCQLVNEPVQQLKPLESKISQLTINKSNNSPQIKQSPEKGFNKIIYNSKDVVRQKTKISTSKHEPREIKQIKCAKILIFNSEDTYIRKILQQNDWVVNPDQKSKFYHLKWQFKPNIESYNYIKDGQYINHIKNSHELTSKNYLNKNLKKALPNWTSLPNCYPKCYDLAETSAKQQFYEEYIKQFMMILLQKIYQYLLQNRREIVTKYQQFYEQLIEGENQYKTEDKYGSFLRKKQFRKIDMQDYKHYDSNCLIHMNLIIVALRYWRHIRKQQELQMDSSPHFLNFGKKQFQQHLDFLQKYSKRSYPSFADGYQRYFQKEYFSTPSSITLERIIKEYVFFNKHLGKYWTVYGRSNTWIIKPCSASRGNGIYLSNNCKDILYNTKGIQSKIVQKYIENPLIFRNPKLNQISNKKFDIRQWVLLRSVNPLQIYMFSHCYVRICSQDYNLSNINNLKSHLTNYSFNKKYYKNASQSVMDHQNFIKIMKQQKNIDFQLSIRPKIKQIIIKSIQSAQESLDDFSQRCFSLLGYDILLDSNCNPWLLEVNMSPACEERTQWLKQYLREMGKGLLQIILPTNYLKNNQKYNLSITQCNAEPESKKTQIFKDKKIKTEISQQHFKKTEQKSTVLIRNVQQTSKANTAQVNMRNSQIPVDSFAKEQLIPNFQHESEGEPITYELFISEHQADADANNQGAQQGGWERIIIPNNLQIESEQQLNKLQLQIAIDDDSDHFDYQNTEFDLMKDDEQAEGNNIEYEIIKQKQVFNSIKNEFSSQQLKWEMICYYQYPNCKKDNDLLLDISGTKITGEQIKQNDIKIDQCQEYQSFIEEAICKIQKQIRNYLHCQRIKNDQRQAEEKQHSSRINFGRLSRNLQEKGSKSIQLQIQQKSIWHYSYLHSYQDDIYQKVKIERPNTGRSKPTVQEMTKIKSTNDTKFKERIKSLVTKAVTNRQNLQLQEMIQARRKSKKIKNNLKFQEQASDKTNEKGNQSPNSNNIIYDKYESSPFLKEKLRKNQIQ